MVAKTEHATHLECQLLAWIQPYRSCILESQKGV